MADLIEVASTELVIGSPGAAILAPIAVASTELAIGSPGVNMVLPGATIAVGSYPIGVGDRGFRLRTA